jgi:hypothetical protein
MAQNGKLNKVEETEQLQRMDKCERTILLEVMKNGH